MAQTTAALSARNAVVEISPDGTTWTDISGFQNKIDSTDQNRKTSETMTFDGDTPIITRGKREGIKVKFAFVYTEGASDPYLTTQAIFENATTLYARWAPGGSTTGNLRYTTSKGYIAAHSYPPVDAASADAIMGGFTLHIASVTEAAIP